MPRLLYIKQPAPDREERLSELIRRFVSDDSASYRRFSTAAQLMDLVSNDLAVLLSERFERLVPETSQYPATYRHRPTGMGGIGKLGLPWR
jgi:hypothetical protein